MPALAPATTDPQVERIVRQAREHLFAHGYSSCTMDHIATELGISKKTLYVHFTSKDELIGAVIEQLGQEIRAEADALLANRSLGFAEKLRGFAEGMAERMARLNPHAIRDLQRYAPALHQQVVEMRQRNIPYVFGRFIEEGQLAGRVRTDINAAFAVEFYLQAMQGVFQSGALERLKLEPRDLKAHAIDLFFGGLLTPVGRKEHEKSFAH